MTAIARLPLAALTLLGSLGYSAQTCAAGLLTPGEQNRRAAQLEKQPMLFFVAKGQADSCGPGCDEWIAAEGTFLPGTAQRFRDFLATLSQKNLPIFLHSRGGLSSEAMRVGLILRERGMTASVGRTLTEGCRVFSKDDVACQRLISSGGRVKARLRTSEGQCHSSCMYALVGAATRRIPPGAIVGVHSARIAAEFKKQTAPDLPKKADITVADVHIAARKYLNLMGVDPGIVDMAAKVDTRRLYILSRDEIKRFGVETSGRYETAWLGHKDPSGRPLIVKTVTEPMGPDGTDHRTSVILASCPFKGWISFSYERVVRSNEDTVLFVVRVAAGAGVGDGGFVSREAIATKVIRATRVFSDLDFFHKAIAAGDMTFIETFFPRDAPNWSRVIKFSTAGLAEALGGWRQSCMES
jgi:hypothetical protein